MPKSRKRKNQDFQKVKLKVGKKLPKGDNVTNLSFKTRQIQLTQKIKDGEGEELVTRRKLSVQDLLRQCDHHSCSARVNAVAGLKELWLSSHSELMHLANVYGYGTILQKIATLFIDNESVVRHSVIGLFKVMLHRLSSYSKIPPRGFPILHIHTYLCCAMAHVHEDIKLDALLLFDILMESFPSLLIHQTGDLLTNLLGFISTSTPNCIGVRADFTTQRLTLNPDSKLPVMKFRQKVLSRVKQIFQTACEDLDQKEKDSDNNVPDSEGKSDTTHMPKMTFTMKGPEQRFQNLFSGSCHDVAGYLCSPSCLEQFIRHAVPVLLQCWKEARITVESQRHSSSVISRDSSEVMSMVVTIIQLAFKLCGTSISHQDGNNDVTLVPTSVLVDTHALEFERILMADFPYSLQVEVSSGKKRKREKKLPSSETPVTFSLDDLNLRLCEIMSRLCSCTTFQSQDRWMPWLEGHLIKLLEQKISTDHTQTVIRTIKNLHSSSMLPLDSPVLEVAVNLFSSCRVTSANKKTLFSIFELIAYNCRKEDLPREDDESHTVNIVYTQLPRLLLAVVGEKHLQKWALDIIALMVHGQTQRCDAFRRSLVRDLTCLLDSKSGVPSCGNDLVVQKFFFMLSLGTPLSKEDYRLILQAVRRPVASPLVPHRKAHSLVLLVLQSLAENIKEVVPFTNQEAFKEMRPEQHTQLSEYLSFMVALQIGFQKEELNQLYPVNSEKLADSPWQFDWALEGDQWNRHTDIVDFVTQELCSVYLPAWPDKGHPDPLTLVSSMEHLWHKALKGRSSMHISTAYSLLQLTGQVSTTSKVSGRQGLSSEFKAVTCQVMSSLVVQLCGRDMTGAAQDVCWRLRELLVQTLHQELSLVHNVLKVLDSHPPLDSNSIDAARQFLLSDPVIKEWTENMSPN